MKKLCRDPDEIKELAFCIQEHREAGSTEFGPLTYEEGVLNTLKWLFFKTATHPTDAKPNDLSDPV